MSSFSFLTAANGNPTPADAQALATHLHRHQTDHAGKPYILHPGRVVGNLLRIYPQATPDMIMAAWLHDTIEDCKIDRPFLLKKGYTPDCVAMIEDVSKPENDTRNYDQVIDDLIATGNIGAMLIKIADNMDNLHPERVVDLMAINPEKGQRLQNRYRASIEKLSIAAGLELRHILISIQNAPKLAA